MSHENLEALLKLEPGSISGIFDEGFEFQYSEQTLRPRWKAFRKGEGRGKARRISIPSDRLKTIQRSLCDLISRNAKPHEIAHAYRAERSNITNAELHIGAKWMLHLDLVNFFGSIERHPVSAALRKALPELGKADIETVSDLCCYKDVLPTGAPTSPILSNLVCQPLDVELDALAGSVGCTIGRFSDDMDMSALDGSIPPELAQIGSSGDPRDIELGEPLLSAIHSHGFEINWRKVRLQIRPDRMWTTGLIVGEHSVSIPSYIPRNCRAALHHWETSGLTNAAQRHRYGCPEKKFIHQLFGTIGYLGKVEGRDSPRYKRLSASLAYLWARDKAQVLSQPDDAGDFSTSDEDENVISPFEL